MKELLDPFVVAPLAAAAGVYAAGARLAWRRAGAGRGVSFGNAAAFAAGMLVLVGALVWPVDPLGEELFSAHMLQHLLLMNVAAPLLVLAAPLQVMVRVLPRAWRRAVPLLVARLSGILFTAALQAGLMFVWHLPGVIGAALRSDALHAAMHASLLAAALLFWTAVLGARGHARWAAFAALLVTAKVMGAACIWLLLAADPSYSAYGAKAAAYGLSALQDEQIGWGLMMVLGATSYLVASVIVFVKALTGVAAPACVPPRSLARS